MEDGLGSYVIVGQVESNGDKKRVFVCVGVL